MSSSMNCLLVDDLTDLVSLALGFYFSVNRTQLRLQRGKNHTKLLREPALVLPKEACLSIFRDRRTLVRAGAGPVAEPTKKWLAMS
jgi:hypothetical protein